MNSGSSGKEKTFVMLLHLLEHFASYCCTVFHLHLNCLSYNHFKMIRLIVEIQIKDHLNSTDCAVIMMVHLHLQAI